MLHSPHNNFQRTPIWTLNQPSPNPGPSNQQQDENGRKPFKTKDEQKYYRRFHDYRKRLRGQKFYTKSLLVAFIVTFLFGAYLQSKHLTTLTNLKTEFENLNTTQMNQFLSLELQLNEYRMELEKQNNILTTTTNELKSEIAILQEDTMDRIKQINLNATNQLKYIEKNTTSPEMVNMIRQVDYDDSFYHFRQSISMMRTEFPSQSHDFWTQVLGGALLTMTEERPSRPSSILILSPSSMSPDFPRCFARKLGLKVNEAFGTTKRRRGQEQQPEERGGKVKDIDSIYINSLWTAGEIQAELKNYLNDEGKAIVIHNPDQIRGEKKLLMLQNFCENVDYLAYDTRANFIFTVTVQEEYDWSLQWNGQQIARRFLNEAWAKYLSPEKRATLISRIVANVVLLQEGDSCD